MAVVNALKNGNAPAGLSAGDYVNTAGGIYQITTPGAFGSSYNPSSGYWSTKRIPFGISDTMSHFKSIADRNNALSLAASKDLQNFQTASAERAMEFSAAEAQKNRDWQKMMSDTAHQREVKDLMAAGLNPVLSAMGGSGAAVTSGAQASGVMPSGGAMPQTDTGFGNQLMSFLTSLIGERAMESVARIDVDKALKVAYMNNKTSLNVAKIQALSGQAIAGMNNATALRQTALNNATSLSTAQLSAETQKDLAKINNDFTEYMRKNYPDTFKQLGASNLAKIVNFILEGNIGSAAAINKFTGEPVGSTGAYGSW